MSTTTLLLALIVAVGVLMIFIGLARTPVHATPRRWCSSACPSTAARSSR